MPPPLRFSLAFGLLAALAVCGCQRLSLEQTIQVGSGDIHSISIDPPRSEQRVSVEFASTESPVSVYLVKEADQPSARKALLDMKTPANVLASKEQIKSGTLEATIPAKTGFSVLVSSRTKDTSVKVKITGK